jgi:hypothetical protein
LATVGIIANPSAGKDIRRLVAHGRYVPNQEKVNVLRRVLSGLGAVGVERVLMMPDVAMLGWAAADGVATTVAVEVLQMTVFNADRDSTTAAELMAKNGVGCLIVLGGDGTNRAVAKASGDVPLVSISTGTNNVFPSAVEGTVAGLAAGVVARGLVDVAAVTRATSVLELLVDGNPRDIALVDIAVSNVPFLGARAIWDMDSLSEIFLSRTDPISIGLASIGARLKPGAKGLHIRLGDGGTLVTAPVAPGMVSTVPVREWSDLPTGKVVEIELRPCTVALDGERTVALSAGQTARVRLVDDGPRVVSVETALDQASLAGVFTDGHVGARP